MFLSFKCIRNISNVCTSREHSVMTLSRTLPPFSGITNSRPIAHRVSPLPPSQIISKQIPGTTFHITVFHHITSKGKGCLKKKDITKVLSQLQKVTGISYYHMYLISAKFPEFRHFSCPFRSVQSVQLTAGMGMGWGLRGVCN